MLVFEEKEKLDNNPRNIETATNKLNPRMMLSPGSQPESQWRQVLAPSLHPI